MKRRILLLMLVLLPLPGIRADIRLINNYRMEDLAKKYAGSRYIKDVLVYRSIVYFGTANGLVCFDTENNRWFVFSKENTPLPTSYIVSLAVDYRNNHIWMATPEGVARYAPDEKQQFKKWTVFRKRDGLADNETTAIAVDEDFVWVGTRFWGISRYDKVLNRWRPKPYTPIDGLGANRIHGLAVDGKQVWAATDDGLSVFDRYTELWFNYDAKQGLSAKQVTCLASDGKGIWAGTYGGGLNYFDKETMKFKVYRTADGLADDTIFSVRSDGLSVWVGTFGGISRFVRGETVPWKNYNKSSHKLIDNAVTAIGIQGNRIWFGTDGEGISLFDKKTPQVHITGGTEYIRQGELGVHALFRDAYPIISYRVLYRPTIFSTQNPVSAGVELVNENRVKGRKFSGPRMIAKIDLKGLRDNFTYDLIVEGVNSRGDRNRSVFLFTVDKTPPVLNVDEMPEAVRTREVFIRGGFLELYLDRVEVSVNKGKFRRVDELDRKSRRFSHKAELRAGENTIEVRITDLGKNSVSVSKKVIYDPDKPVFLIDDSVRKGVSASTEFTIRGRVKEAGLSTLYLMPGRIRMTWKKVDDDLWSFEQKVTLTKGSNGFVISAVDQAGSKTEENLVIRYNTAAPSLSFDDDMPREVGSRFLTVKGKWDDKDLREIIITPGDVRATIDREKKTFWAKISLPNDFTIIRATAIDDEDNKNTISISVTYNQAIQDKNRDAPMRDAQENYRLYVRYKKQYDDLLARYKKLLLKYEKLEKDCRRRGGGKTGGGGGLFIPGGQSVFFAPYNRQGGDTMESLARTYLKDPSAKRLIAGFNNNTPGATARSRGRLLIPTAALIRHLYSAPSRSTSWNIVDAVSEAFGTAGPGRSFHYYRQVIANALRARGLLPGSAAPPDNLYELKGRALLLLHAWGNFNRSVQLMRLRMVAKKAGFGYIVTFHGSFIRFHRIQ